MQSIRKNVQMQHLRRCGSNNSQSTGK